MQKLSNLCKNGLRTLNGDDYDDDDEMNETTRVVIYIGI